MPASASPCARAHWLRAARASRAHGPTLPVDSPVLHHHHPSPCVCACACFRVRVRVCVCVCYVAHTRLIPCFACSPKPSTTSACFCRRFFDSSVDRSHVSARSANLPSATLECTCAHVVVENGCALPSLPLCCCLVVPPFAFFHCGGCCRCVITPHTPGRFFGLWGARNPSATATAAASPRHTTRKFA